MNDAIQGVLHHGLEIVSFRIQITKLLVPLYADRTADLFRKYVIKFILYTLQNAFYFLDTILASREFLLPTSHKTHQC